MNINGVNNIFPLNLLNTNFTDYYMDANGRVYSTKRVTTPQVMLGSTTGFGSRRRHVYSFSSPNTRQATQQFGDDLFAKAKRHADWALHTSGHPIANAAKMPNFITKDRDHAQTLEDGLRSKGYIIGQVQGEALVFGSKPKVHTTLTSVKEEVARLASKSPGTKIVYLKVEGMAVANGIAWV